MAIGDVVAHIIRSDGQEFLLGGNDWGIAADGLSGWASVEPSVSYVEIPNADGALVTSSRVPSRDRTLKARVRQCRSTGVSSLREAAIRFFNPKYTFKVFMTYMGRTRWCEGRQIAFSMSEGNIYAAPELQWTILCENPYMQSVEDFGKDIAEVTGAFGFPFMSFLPESAGSMPGTNTGFITSVHTFDQNVDVSNDGDVPCGLNVTITAKGHVVNPSVRLGEGWVRLLIDMKDGDTAYIDATTKPPKVLVNGANAMNRVDRESSILNMMLAVGSTTLEYDADDGYQNMSVVVRYNKQYLGV